MQSHLCVEIIIFRLIPYSALAIRVAKIALSRPTPDLKSKLNVARCSFGVGVVGGEVAFVKFLLDVAPLLVVRRRLSNSAQLLQLGEHCENVLRLALVHSKPFLSL